jgi:hypothetical protein
MTSAATFLQANGKLRVDGWILIWTPVGDDETLSDADNALTVIDPSRLFADSVKKAMFIGAPEFERTSDSAAPAHGQTGHSIKETGPVMVSRWVPQPPERARVVLFGRTTGERNAAADFVDGWCQENDSSQAIVLLHTSGTFGTNQSLATRV